MSQNRLHKLPLDPDRLDRVRSYFEDLEDNRETFERGLALEKMNAETAWLDEEGPALYYLHDESAAYPADLEADDVDDQGILELGQAHQQFFQEVAADGYDHPEDLEELEPLFHASARDRIE